MKILFIGVFSDTSTNNSQSRAFTKLGCNVIDYNYRERARILNSSKLRDDEIITYCKNERPDIVLFSKCNGVGISVIDECNKISKTILWYMDPMNANFNNELIEKIKRCSQVVCAKYLAMLKSLEYNPNSVWCCEGFDAEIDIPYECEQDIDISFIGSLYGERQNLCNSVNAKIFTAYGSDHARIVGRSKINLNFCTNYCASDRVYKVLASKGFLITDDWRCRTFLNLIDGENIVLFSGAGDLKEKINYYLSHDDERLKIVEQGYKDIQPYNRDNWAKFIMGDIK